MGLGVVFALMAAIGWGSADVFARKAMQHIQASTLVVAMATLILITLAVAVVFTDGVRVLLGLPWYVYVLTGVMGFLAHVGGQLFYLWGIQRAGLTIAAPILGGMPLFAVFLGVVLGGERPNVPTLLGAFIIVGGIVLILTDRNRMVRP